MDLDSIIADSKAKIGAIIQKPKMTEKLLSKPPFRFLHDTISAITAATGFGDGLYSGDELDSGKIADKQQKINYLDKIITVVGICQGKPVDIRAAKVVAGLEAENTNLFLIALADCASDSSLDHVDAVRRCLNGEQAGQGPAAIKRSSSPPPAKQSAQAKDDDESKAPDVKRSNDPDPVAQERGQSRGGSRGGKPSSGGAASISGLHTRPVNLDADIEKCDGSLEATKEILGSVISRPKLADKLLSKPPFRFLHDIVMEVTKATGFGANLYSTEDTDSANVKDKNQKIEFLEKIVKVVGIQLNTLIEARPAKIVAGLEPQNTNVFLQLLGLAAKNMPDSSNAVRAVLEQSNSNGDGDGDNDGDAGNAPAPAPVPAASRVEEKPKAEEKEKPRKSSTAPVPVAAAEKEDTSSKADDRRELIEDKPTDDGQGNEDDGKDNKRSLRPTTARRRPPKVKDTAREVSAKETASTVKKAEGILIDGQVDDDDEDVVPEEKRLADELTAYGKGSATGNEQQSKIVKDILSRQAEQEARKFADEDGVDESKAGGGGGGADNKSSGIRLGRLRKTGAEKKGGSSSGAIGTGDMDRLRSAIQVLVQHTGPLGTCMDYIQEDVGIMTSELHRWETECARYENDCENEKRKTETILRPLVLELADLEKQVEDQQVKIATTKASIARNNATIIQALKALATS